MWRPTLAVAALGLLLAGCGQHSSQRADVARYLRQVNRVERALASPLAAVTTVGGQFAQEQRSGGTLTGLLTAAEHARLRTALSHMSALRSRLAALPAPRPAARLRGLLLQVIDGQVRLTREVAQLVVFLPGLGTALRPLAPATQSLQAVLARQAVPGSTAVSSSYGDKAAALHRFRAVVRRMLKQLRQLRPPALERPVYAAELASLQGMGRSAGELADALQVGPRGALQPLLTRFDRAAGYTQTVSVQKAEIAAVRAYDGAIIRLTRLSQEVERERLRLANNLS